MNLGLIWMLQKELSLLLNNFFNMYLSIVFGTWEQP